MFLKKVEISGFKSFANKSTLEFLPACAFDKASAGKPAVFDVGRKSCGITAIVGPNGSGKSNVADAIRWAMGEQSMKNLRGKKSEDIIFAGSGKKARLGSAWTTLHFDNADKRIPLEFSEVAITRKIFRSGESEYLINGSRVRLIDIVDLLAKAGIGRESYCVINQGMSDSVLNATPAERRSVIEDAAGVKQYQIKKERSIRKLESTRNNLGRVGDLIKEIEPHLRLLKRQAEKAEKGKGLGAELKTKQVKLFSYLWHKFQSERESASQEKNELGARMMNVQRAADKLSDEIGGESKKFQDSKIQDELEKKRRELNGQLNELEKDLVITEGRMEIEKEKISNRKIIESIPVDLGYVKEKLQAIRNDQEKLIGRLEKAESLEELQDIKEFARVVQERLFELYESVGKGSVEIHPVKYPQGGSGETGFNGVKKEETPEDQEEKKKIAVLAERAEKLRKDIAELKVEIEKIEKQMEAEIEKGKEMRKRFFELEREAHQKQEELNKLKDQFNEAKIRLARVEVREEDLTVEIKNEINAGPGEFKFDGEEINSEEYSKEINRLKVQLEQVGGIDPMIVDEYNETKNRFEFLTKESADLEEAINSLKEVVKEMDQKISETFSVAFKKINDEFTKYFRIIFGGGTAHLLKTKIQKRKPKEEVGENGDLEGETDEMAEEEKEEEVAEVGIDISACPPGKKISHLSMLSGGERSLTSLALLFAIIAYNPPPFAILDEVEAALDEANSRRFGRILQELSGNTQFIAITHNRETMRQASLLYGVTMGEDGISKLLSVHLDQIGQGGKIKE